MDQTPDEIERQKQECYERWQKYWRLAQTVSALGNLQQRREAVERHTADYPHFPELVRQAWEKRRDEIARAKREAAKRHR